MKKFIEKHLYKYRGKRIKYKTRYVVKKAGILIGLPAFLVLLFLTERIFQVMPVFPLEISLEGISEYVQAINYMGVFYTVISSLGFSFLFLFIIRIIFFDRYIILKQKQQVAKFIIDRGWYDTKSVQKERKNWLEDIMTFGKSTPSKTITKERMAYFPRVYFRHTNDFIYIRFPTDGSAYQENYLEVAKSLEVMLFAELVSEVREEGFICYQFIYAISRDRLRLEDVVAKNGALQLMKRSEWKYDKMPHMLISGGTGAGKTYVILSVLLGLVKGECQKEDIYIADPKNADLADLEGIFPRVYSQATGIQMVIHQFRQAMVERSEQMKQHPNYETGKNYRALGLRPQFLIFDEVVAFMEMLDYKEQSKVMSDLKQIVMLGRQAGFFLIAGLQRPDAKYLADGIRDQFHYRIALGKNSEVGYSMMFGDTDKKFSQKEVVGFGYADSGKGVISEFYSPLVPKDFDFIEAFKKVG